MYASVFSYTFIFLYASIWEMSNMYVWTLYAKGFQTILAAKIDFNYLDIMQWVNSSMVFNHTCHDTFITFCSGFNFLSKRKFHSRHFLALKPFYTLRTPVHELSQPYIMFPPNHIQNIHHF